MSEKGFGGQGLENLVHGFAELFLVIGAIALGLNKLGKRSDKNKHSHGA